MAKKVEGYIKLQIPAGKATPAPPVGPALGQHGVNIVEFTKQFNARTADQGRPDYPGCYHSLQRQKLQLRYKDSAGSSIDQESLQPEIRFRRSEQEQSCYDHKSSGRRNRKIENAGPERCNSRGSYEHDRRNMPFYGCNRRGVS